MFQIVFERPGLLSMREAPIPEPQPGEALLRVHRVGICGSDLHAFAGTHPAYTFPRVPGHELGCEVVDVRTGVSNVKPGDRCAVDAYLSCGACPVCRRGRPNACEDLRYYGVHMDGGMREYFCVPADRLHTSSQLTYDELALVEPLSIGANSVVRSGMQPGEKVLIVGVGPIGLAALQFALATGAKVRALERLPWRRKLAEDLGVETISSPDGRLADVVIDATGNPASMEASFHAVASGGRLVFVGVVKASIAFDDWLFHRRELTVLASRASVGLFPGIIEILEQGRIDTSSWITERLALKDVPARFAGLMERSNQIKVMVEV